MDKYAQSDAICELFHHGIKNDLDLFYTILYAEDIVQIHNITFLLLWHMHLKLLSIELEISLLEHWFSLVTC